MPEFARPHVRFQRSFLEAVREFVDAGEDERYHGLTVIGALGDFPGEVYSAVELADPDRFALFANRLRLLADPSTPLPPGIVPATHLWWVDGDAYLGRLSIRHSLTQWLRDYGGHIGYVVRPSARRQGNALAMLRAALPFARELGIEYALVTCDDDNVASRRVIEAQGGVFDDQRAEKLRYWLPTG